MVYQLICLLRIRIYVLLTLFRVGYRIMYTIKHSYLRDRKFRRIRESLVVENIFAANLPLSYSCINIVIMLDLQ